MKTPKLSSEPVIRHSNLNEAQLNELHILRKKYIDYLISITEEDMKHVNFDLNKIYPSTENIDELTDQVSDLKKCLDSFRPLNPEQVEYLNTFFDIEYTYNSNKIEGNTLTYRETSFILEKGLTIGGKSMNDHLEAINHKEAIVFMRDLVEQKEAINDYNLRQIHGIILRSIYTKFAGVYRNIPVRIGNSKHIPPEAYLVPKQMEDYFHFYEENKDKLHPVILSAEMHKKLVNVHPFVDGNGRTSRLIMNMVLLQNGYPIAILSGENEDRNLYYDALEKAHVEKDSSDFHRLILKKVKEMLYQYLDMISQNIGEDEQDKGYYYFQKIKDYL